MPTGTKLPANPGGKNVTVKDLARELGLGTMTVSRALSGSGPVAPRTRERVLEAARRLRYEPNVHARGLASSQGQGIALFSLLLMPGGSASVIERLQRELNARGFDAPLHGFGSYDWTNPSRQVELVRALRRSRPRVIVCNNTYLTPEAHQEFRAYQDCGGILVCFGHASDMPCDQVLPSYADMVRHATRYLIELGHRYLGYFDPGLHNDMDPNSLGFLRALEEAGIEPNPAWLWAGPPYEEGGVWLAEQYRALPVHERPTAIVSTMDATASVFIHQVERAGVRVPQDISLIGMNGVPASQYWRPALTVMQQPFDELARCAAELVQRRLDGEQSPPQRVPLFGKLVLRETTEPPQK